MAVNNLYRLTYHFEKNGIRQTDTFHDDVIVSATDKTSLYNVLNGNSKVPSGLNASNLVIVSVGHLSTNVLS